MKISPAALAVWAICLSAVPAALPADEQLAQEGLRQIAALEAAFRRAVERARPSVVSVFIIDRTDVNNPLGGGAPATPPFRQEPPEPDNFRFFSAGIGSGIVVDKQGSILTYYHVVRSVVNTPQYQILVRLPDGRSYPARIHAADPRSDLAVIQLKTTEPLALTPIKIADGAELFVGQFVLAIGNPYGTAAPDGSTSASWGIVSNIRRRAVPVTLDDVETRQSLLAQGTLVQTDARLNMGVSGGALINVRGELVGITMALSAATGFETPGGFAVPTNELTRRIIATLAAGREVEYGFIGVEIRTITAAEAARDGQPLEGAFVSRIYHYLPAHRAGLRQGDIITKINGKRITTRNDLVLSVGSLPVGTVLDAEIVRGQAVMRLKLPLAKYPVRGEIIATNKRPAWNGIRVDHLSVLADQRPFGLDAFNSYPEGGVVLREIEEGSPAFKKELRPGQIVTKVNGKTVESPDEFDREVSRAQPPVRLTLFREPEVVFETPAK